MDARKCNCKLTRVDYHFRFSFVFATSSRRRWHPFRSDKSTLYTRIKAAVLYIYFCRGNRGVTAVFHPDVYVYYSTEKYIKSCSTRPRVPFLASVECLCLPPERLGYFRLFRCCLKYLKTSVVHSESGEKERKRSWYKLDDLVKSSEHFSACTSE